jgi:hypothetical protein
MAALFADGTGTNDPDNIVGDLVGRFRQSGVAVFVGAGYSRPSGLPTAGPLEHSVLTAIGASEADADAVLSSGVRFERVFQIVSEHADISPLMSVFELGRPSTNQLFLARLARRHLLFRVLTTNFDTLVEKALECEGLKRREDYTVVTSEPDLADCDRIPTDTVAVLKVHGSVDEPRTIRLVLDEIATGIQSRSRFRSIEDVLQRGDHSIVLFLGYSASDDFDLNPMLARLSFPSKEVLIVAHQDGLIGPRGHLADLGKRAFARMSGSWVRADTGLLVRAIWRELKPEIGPVIDASGSVDWISHVHEWAATLSPLIRRAILYDIVQDATPFEVHSVMRVGSGYQIDFRTVISERAAALLDPFTRGEISYDSVFGEPSDPEHRTAALEAELLLANARGQLDEGGFRAATAPLANALNRFKELHRTARSRVENRFFGRRLCQAATLLSYCHYRLHDFGPAGREISEAALVARRIGYAFGELEAAILDVHLELEIGLVTPSIARRRIIPLIEDAEDLAQRCNVPGYRVECLLTLADILGNLALFDEAERRLAEARQVAGEHGLNALAELLEASDVRLKSKKAGHRDS